MFLVLTAIHFIGGKFNQSLLNIQLFPETQHMRGGVLDLILGLVV